MIDMQVGTEDIVNILEPEAVRGEAVEPGLLWKVQSRSPQRLMFADAGVNQNIVPRGAHDKCLVSDNQQILGGIVNLGRHGLQVGEGSRMIGFREHDGRRAPGTVPFNEAGYQNVADVKGSHEMYLLFNAVRIPALNLSGDIPNGRVARCQIVGNIIDTGLELTRGITVKEITAKTDTREILARLWVFLPVG